MQESIKKSVKKKNPTLPTGEISGVMSSDRYDKFIMYIKLS